MGQTPVTPGRGRFLAAPFAPSVELARIHGSGVSEAARGTTAHVGLAMRRAQELDNEVLEAEGSSCRASTTPTPSWAARRP